jgi:hypothetical protein
MLAKPALDASARSTWCSAPIEQEPDQMGGQAASLAAPPKKRGTKCTNRRKKKK